ncbi:MAG: hypothetical protein J6J42_09440 [Lachnospiraceae bacterium]|nr:hypothetical protein [Lachnospiraceae bacterium]
MKNKRIKMLLLAVLLFAVAVTAGKASVFAAELPAVDSETLTETEEIDLSLHAETAGDFTSVYGYQNPFLGKDTSQGVVLEFYAAPTGDAKVLATVFSFIGTGDYEGRFYFTPGSYLGYNAANYGGIFDANIANYALVEDFIKTGAMIRIEVTPAGFAVYADDALCYDQTIFADTAKSASGEFADSTDFSPVLTFLANAQELHFGYGSWWNAAGFDEALMKLSKVNFRLADGTVVMDGFKVDQTLLESLGGTAADTSTEELPAEVTPEPTPAPAVDSLALTEAGAIDLSVHMEKSGEFTSMYTYQNPFLGKDTSAGVSLEFYALPTWELKVLGTIFSFMGTGEYDGRLYFTPGSYLGYNSGNYGGFFDANLANYMLVKDYIRDGAKIHIEITPAGFSVYSNDVLCYDQSILEDASRGAHEYADITDYTPVLNFLAGAQELHFGHGSWWNTNESELSNIMLSEVCFKLADGTVVMDGLRVEKEKLEAAGGSVISSAPQTEQVDILENLDTVAVEIFDINSVEYDGESVTGQVIAVVAVAAVIALAVLLFVFKKREYSDI